MRAGVTHSFNMDEYKKRSAWRLLSRAKCDGRFQKPFFGRPVQAARGEKKGMLQRVASGTRSRSWTHAAARLHNENVISQGGGGITWNRKFVTATTLKIGPTSICRNARNIVIPWNTEWFQPSQRMFTEPGPMAPVAQGNGRRSHLRVEALPLIRADVAETFNSSGDET